MGEVVTPIKEAAHQILAGRREKNDFSTQGCILDRDWAVFKGHIGSIMLLELFYMVAQLQRVPFMSVSM